MDFELIPEDETHDGGAFISYARTRATAKQERDPDVGDVVHFWDDVDARCRAATVTQDDLTTVWLHYLMPGEPTPRCVRDVAHSETKADGTWHWPCGGH